METEKLNVDRLDSRWRLLPSLHQAFMVELGRAGASDAALRTALVLTRVLNTWSYRSFSTYAAAQESGLTVPELTRAVMELVDLGALDVRKKTALGRRMTAYRLGSAIGSCTGFFMAPPEVAETANGDVDA